jgi:hypothetical protein
LPLACSISVSSLYQMVIETGSVSIRLGRCCWVLLSIRKWTCPRWKWNFFRQFELSREGEGDNRFRVLCRCCVLSGTRAVSGIVGGGRLRGVAGTRRVCGAGCGRRKID